MPLTDDCNVEDDDRFDVRRARENVLRDAVSASWVARSLTFLIVLTDVLSMPDFISVAVLPAPDEVKVEADFAIGARREVVQIFAQNDFLISWRERNKNQRQMETTTQPRIHPKGRIDHNPTTHTPREKKRPPPNHPYLNDK